MSAMSSISNFNPSDHFRSAEVYTDLNSLQELKNIDDKEQALRKVSQQFESIFVSLMLKSMRDANAVFEQDSMFSSNETQFYRDMYDQQLALTMSHSGPGGIGVAEALYRQLSAKSGVESKTLNTNLQTSRPDRQFDLPPRGPGNTGSTGTERAVLASSPEEFIRLLEKPLEQAAKSLGVDKNVLMAQAALETGWGKHVIAKGEESSFNLFNIKAGSQWKGDTVNVSSLEYSNGTFKPEASSFRCYSSIEESVNDYLKFVQENPRYKEALENVNDSAAYIRTLHQAGYATDPEYADKVLDIQQRINSQLAEVNASGRGV